MVQVACLLPSTSNVGGVDEGVCAVYLASKPRGSGLGVGQLAVFFLGLRDGIGVAVSSWLRGENGNELHGLASD